MTFIPPAPEWMLEAGHRILTHAQIASHDGSEITAEEIADIIEDEYERVTGDGL